MLIGESGRSPLSSSVPARKPAPKAKPTNSTPPSSSGDSGSGSSNGGSASPSSSAPASTPARASGGADDRRTPSSPAPKPSGFLGRLFGGNTSPVTESDTTEGSDTESDTVTVGFGLFEREVSREEYEEIQAEREEREETFQQHLSALEGNFSNVDDRGDNDQDGNISHDDIEAIAKGDYDRGQALERLQDSGLSEDEAEDKLEEMEEAAQYFNDNDDSFDRLDGANDGGDTDGDVSFGDVDELAGEHQEDVNKAREAELESGEIDGVSQDDVRQSLGKYDTQEELEAALELNSDLDSYGEADLRALAALAGNDENAAAILQGSVEDVVLNAEDFDDLDGLGLQQLVANGVAGSDSDAAQRLDELTADKVEALVDSRLAGRRGDSAAEGAIDRLGLDVEGLALQNPALAEQIGSAVEDELGGRSGDFEKISKADDNALQKAGGWVADRIGDVAELGTKINDFVPLPVLLPAYELKFATRAAGAVADKVGLDTIAGGLNTISDGADSVTSFVDRQEDSFLRGVATGAGSTVEGLTQLVGAPVETVKGFGQVIQDPSLLLDSYKNTYKENGLAGLAGQVAFDVLGTKGAGSVVSKSAKLTELAENVGKVTKVTDVPFSFIDDLGTRGRNYLGNTAPAQRFSDFRDGHPGLDRFLDGVDSLTNDPWQTFKDKFDGTPLGDFLDSLSPDSSAPPTPEGPKSKKYLQFGLDSGAEGAPNQENRDLQEGLGGIAPSDARMFKDLLTDLLAS